MTDDKCPTCGSTKLRKDYERGEILCMQCGTVVSDNVADYGPEWRAFDAEQREKRARGGAPTRFTRPNKGLSTEIDMKNVDLKGGRISAQKQAQMYRIRKWHKRASIASSVERNLAIALTELDRIASYLGLSPDIREAAAVLYRRCIKAELIRGRLIESVVAAVIYAVCRMNGIPRTLDEIAKVSSIEKKEIGRAYRFIRRELGLDVPLTDPTQYVPKFVAALKLSGEVQETAIKLLKDSLKGGLISGRGPTGVAAAAVYIASALHSEKRTQKEVADVAGVTEVTIRNRYRELKKELKIDIDL
ncbi:MAG: transcription initiation factor IIB [Candidatus Aenigmatarchaeota archaeon]